MMISIALTGGIAKGKSTVLEIIKQYQIPVVSADDIARNVIARKDIQQHIASTLKLSLPLTRECLREKLVSDRDAKKYLDDLLHPLIIKEILASRATVAEVPLLFEAGYQNHFKKIWLVSCSEDIRLKRLVNRLGSEEIARKLIAIQADDLAKIKYCNELIETDVPLRKLKEKIRTLLQKESLIR